MDNDPNSPFEGRAPEDFLVSPDDRQEGSRPHRGVRMTGEDGDEGPKAFYIQIEARPGREEDVVDMLRDIRACVEDEPGTGPWYGFRYSRTSFGIFEAFPDIAARQAHVDGRGGDIFRDAERMNAILASPAHVMKVDPLFSKQVFAEGATPTAKVGARDHG